VKNDNRIGSRHPIDDLGGDAPNREARRGARVTIANRRFPRALHGGVAPWTSHLWFSDGYAKSEVMPSDPDQPPQRPTSGAVPDPTSKAPPLPRAAQRALAEAAARRAERERKATDQPKEAGGRDGPDPTRYGDWEINGLASDF
jgi:hypothetical protein